MMTAHYKIAAVNGTRESDQKSINILVPKAGNKETINKFDLSQNYPNPFNPKTNIQYSLATDEFVDLRVYDLLGNEVATLINTAQAAGSYSIIFDAADLPSGIYIYKITAGKYSDTKKLLLVK